MKSIALISILIFFTSQNILAQRWDFNKGKDPFNGEYLSASTVGKGSNYPYTKPKFVINYFTEKESLNIYFTDVGYSGCENKKIKITFDEADTIFLFGVTSDKNNEVWFIKETHGVRLLIDRIREQRKMFVLVESECNENYLEFSLNGSSNALKEFSFEKYFEKEEDKFNDLVEKAIEYKNKGWTEESNDLFYQASKINKQKADSIKATVYKKSEDFRERSCYERLIRAFDERGINNQSEIEKETVYISIRETDKINCFYGEALVREEKIIKLWILDNNSNPNLIFDSDLTELSVNVSNGYSGSFSLNEKEFMGVFLITRLREK